MSIMKKEKKKDRKPFYKVWWYYVVVALFFVINVAVLIGVRGDLQANLLTFISGWISFVATVMIGIVAFKQSERYKKDSDEAVEQQYDFEIAKLIIEDRVWAIRYLKEDLREFLKVFDYSIIRLKLSKIDGLQNQRAIHIQQSHLEQEVYFFASDIQIKSDELKKKIQNDIIECEAKQMLIGCLEALIKEYKKGVTGLNRRLADTCLLPLHDKLKDAIYSYLVYLDTDINTLLVENIRDTAFIKSKYCKNK